MTIRELIEKRNQAFEAAKNYAASHKNEKGTLSNEDYEVYMKMEKEIEDYSREISRFQREEQLENELSKPINTPITLQPQSGVEAKKNPRATAEYKNAMVTALRTKFKNISNVLQESVDTDGGYLVPEEYDSRLIDVLEEENIMRRLATRIKTEGLHKINIAATKPAASWTEEGKPISFSDATFEQLFLDAYKLDVAIKVTDELLYDSAFDLESYIIEKFGNALSNAEEDAFLNGDGNGKPTGIFDETGGGTTADTVAELTGDNIVDLVYALKRAYRKKAVFIINDNLIAKIRKLKDNTGAYIWQAGLQEGEPNRILGYRVETSEYAPTDAIAFGDMSYYNIGDRGERSFKELKELFAGNDMTGFMAKERVDGKLVLKEAVQILRISKPASSTKTSTSKEPAKA